MAGIYTFIYKSIIDQNSDAYKDNRLAKRDSALEEY